MGTLRIPPKPRRGKRSPFYWWRRWKSHQYLPVKKGLLARIQNGDSECKCNLVDLWSSQYHKDTTTLIWKHYKKQ